MRSWSANVVRFCTGAERRFVRRVALLSVLLVAWALRAHHLDARPLWVDEAFSLWMARLSLPDLVAKSLRIDQHPPLYYLTLKGWVALVGDTEWALRSLSALWGTLTVPLAFALGRRVLGNARAALFVTTFVALSPFHVRYAQEARMYTLLALGGLTTLYLLTRLAFPSPWDPERVGRHKGSYLTAGHDQDALFLGVTMALTAFTHGLGLLVPLTVMLFLFLIRPPRRRTFIALAIFALLWWPWLPAFIHQAQGVVRRFWVPWPTWRDVWRAFHDFHAAYLSLSPVSRWGVDLLFLLLAGLGFWTTRNHARLTVEEDATRPTVVGAMGFFWLVPLLVELVLSLLRPVFQPRTLIWTTFPYYVLVAGGVSELASSRARHLAPIAIMCVLLVQALGLRGWYTTPPPERWDQAVVIVQNHARSNDLLLFNAAWTQLPFVYYADRAGLCLKDTASQPDRSCSHPSPVPTWDEGLAGSPLEARGIPEDIAVASELEPLTTTAHISYVEHLVADKTRVWLIYSHEWYTDPQGITRRVLERHFTLARLWELPGIRIFLYQIRGR